MPGWHGATTELRSSGDLATLGVVTEQHPDRARLFMAWKEMDWPLLWDPFNLLELPAVPITLVLDPDGIIRLIQPKMTEIDAIGGLIRSNGWRQADDVAELASPVPGIDALEAPVSSDAAGWLDHATALALWGGESRLDEAVDAARHAVESAPGSVAWFRRGVILRLRHDSSLRRETDFAEATQAWTNALEADPANYIWRRRLQQYGPRLAKPYAFYDWVKEARAELEARGETPPVLVVEPEGAEFAAPISQDEAGSTIDAGHPDPDGRLVEDEVPHIEIRVGVVPSRVPPGDAARVHLDLAPDATGTAHWNNEAGPGAVWVEGADGWAFEPQHQALSVPPEATSDERRHVEFEVRVPEECADGVYSAEVVMLYHICEDETGVCMIRRRNITVSIPVESGAVGLGD